MLEDFSAPRDAADDTPDLVASPPPLAEPKPVPHRRNAALIALPLVGLGGLGYLTLGHGGKAAADAPQTPIVTVARPLQRDVTEWDDYIGRFAASQAVEVKPRVSGQLVGIHFRDGDIVRKGQLLFTIDPRPFAAAMAEAQARAAAARTAAGLARAELVRAEALIDDEAVSAQEVDSLRAAARSAQAQVAAADAAVRARALDVEFTRITAPVSGRISDRRVDVGNLVAGDQSTSATLLTTINALDPIYFEFDGSEALYLKAQRAKAEGRAGGDVAQIKLQDETGYRWIGKIDFTDNGIDPGSGTIRGRAIVANPDYFLAPGLFGNMRLAAGGGGSVPALLVPDAAVVTDQVRKVVMVVDASGTVAARPVTVGPAIDGLRVIRAGLSPADRVVIAGVQFAQPGAKVSPRTGRITAERIALQASAAQPTAAQVTFAR